MVGVGVAVRGGLAVRGALAALGEGRTTAGVGDWLARYSATGTTTRPANTVATKVAAPHSRRRKVPQFTSGRF
jgi:hypothetical protein